MTGAEVIKVRDQLKTERAPFEALWTDLAEIFTPYRTLNTRTPDFLAADRLFDATGRASAEIFANGLCSLIVPRDEKWFEYTPPGPLKQDDDAVKWYRQASATALDYIEASNFYEEIQESLIESPIFGTCALHVGELDGRGELTFLHLPIATYYIGEDSTGRVATLCRDLCLTPDQAAQEFGRDELPPKIAAKVGKPEGLTEKFTFIHLVTRRVEDIEPDAPEAKKRGWLDLVVCEESKRLVRDSTTFEFPFAAHRYRKWGKGCYGFGPGYLAAGDARQLSFLNELADLGTEKAVFPPLIAPASMEGEIDQSALGLNYYDENSPGGRDSVKELHSQARFDILEWRMSGKKDAIEKAFHVDLFKLFSNRQHERGPLTATEANLVAGEKLTQFSPVYGRIMSEMIDNILQRVFGVLFRAGAFGPPPPSVGKVLNGRAQVALPAVQYRNRIALAMKAKDNGALMSFLEVMLPVLQAFPQLAQTIFNAFETPTMVRELIRNSGTPEQWISTVKAIAEREAAQAAAAAKQAQLEQAKLATDSAKNLGSAPPEMLAQLRQQIP